MYMGKVSFPFGKNVGMIPVIIARNKTFLAGLPEVPDKRACFADLLYGGLLKTVCSEENPRSRNPIGSSDVEHPATAALWADMNVDPPDSLQEFCSGKSGVFSPETLVPLEGKDQPEVFAFPTVIQEAVITDFLETRREHMHQVAADKFGIAQCDRPIRVTGLFAPGQERCLLFIYRENPVV